MPKGRSRIFGPVLSRRLGLSLGVDMVPKKTCTYDCIYCEVGPTTCKSSEPTYFFDPDEMAKEIVDAAGRWRPDFVTFGGSGEPTLNLHLGYVVKEIKRHLESKTALLTNASLLFREDVRRAVMDLDLILPTFSAGSPEVFQALHSPRGDLSLEGLKEGIRALRREFKGRIWMEVMLVSGINDRDSELLGIREFIREIGPERVQVGTVERPPADPSARPVDGLYLYMAREFLGEKAEMISPKKGGPAPGLAIQELLETLKRRPLKDQEVFESLGVGPAPPEEVLSRIEASLGLKRIRQGGGFYYALKGSL
jgi:wyosine [tRNA(Phe)-imidazoG37] synthetase (radical SAM superfamily)